MNDATPRKQKNYKPTAKQKALIKAKIENPDATYAELALKAHYNDAQAAYAALNGPTVKKRMAELMEGRKNLKDEALLDHLEEGLEATKKVAVKAFGDEDSELVMSEVPDWGNRHKYFSTALQLKGALDTGEGEKPQTQILIINAIDRAIERGIGQ